MLDIKFIRENLEAVKQGAKNKRINIDIDRLVELDSKIKPMKQELEELQHKRNTLSKTIGKAPAEEREPIKKQVLGIKQDMEKLDASIGPLEAELKELMLCTPQPAREDVPIGKDDQDNIEIRTWGTIPNFDFKIKDHVELGTIHDIIDIPGGVKLAGSRSYILKGAGAIIEQAVMRYTYDKLIGKGYSPLSIPVLVSESCMEGTGYFPTGRDQAYFIEKDNLALVGTSEVSLTSYFANEIHNVDQLPQRVMAHSSCFRREAGTYGKDTHGLYRVHQFQKIEQVIIGPADANSSEELHNELLSNAEELMQDLGLPYRVVYVCTGDLGMGQLRKHDIETWMPSRNLYSETHSCSTFHEYQARRLMMRYKDKNGKTQYCHTLNNTAIASPRVLIPLLEMNQQADGNITIPECLHKYTNGLKELRK